MRLQPWWYSRTQVEPGSPLQHRVSADVVVIGGGVAGLHAALRLNADGARVVLLEKTFCGRGMSGLSSGFLTPDSEMGLREFIRRFGPARAAALWEIAWNGVRLIASTARAHAFECDLCECDCLFVGDGPRGAADVRAEREAHLATGYKAVHYEAEALAAVHPGGYAGGLRYGGTWTMDPFAYCRGLRALLIERGAQVFENSEVTALNGTTALTAHGAATGRAIVWCANQLSPQISRRAYRQYSVAETCLSISEPLSADQIAAVFPAARLQCWDSRLIYNYYRLTGDGRLLLGGGSLWMSIAGHATPAEAAATAGVARFKRRFPALDRADFGAYWPGLIDVTRDLIPWPTLTRTILTCSSSSGAPASRGRPGVVTTSPGELVAPRCRTWRRSFGGTAGRSSPMPFRMCWANQPVSRWTFLPSKPASVIASECAVVLTVDSWCRLDPNQVPFSNSLCGGSRSNRNEECSPARAAGIVLKVRHLRGKMVSKVAGTGPVFDDQRSYVLRMFSADLTLDMASLTNLMNDHAFAWEDAPIKEIEMSVDEGRLIQKGKMHKGVWLPFSMKASVGVTPDGRMLLHTESVKALQADDVGIGPAVDRRGRARRVRLRSGKI